MSATISEAHPPPCPQPSSKPNSQSPSQPRPANPAASRSSKSRRHSLPFVFPPLSQPNSSSISLVPSTAEGKPIPLDDSTAAHRTTALRELNRTQPSARHRYTQSSGAPSATSTTTGTYSQPVIVRTYSGPPPASSTSRPASRRIPVSSITVTSSASNWRPGRNGMVLNMPRHKGPKQKPQAGHDVKLPPMEAFTFKSIMQDMQQDIGADLDRIAEICARSRYSLSNQYEVHVAPHGSGAGFLASASGSSSRHQIPGGLTLQAVSSDDENSTTRHRRRRGGARRRSAAYGTLETIMSSSRSSEEEKTKKKSAAEIADEVRGRASKNTKGESSSSTGSEHPDEQDSSGGQPRVTRRKSTSFATALIDSTRHSAQGDNSSPRASGSSLVSEPARPKTYRSHLEIRTSQDDATASNYAPEPASEPTEAVVSDSVASAAIANPEDTQGQPGLLSNLSSWIPWRGPVVVEVATSDAKGSKTKSYAEGSLRELLKTTETVNPDVKGKGTDGI